MWALVAALNYITLRCDVGNAFAEVDDPYIDKIVTHYGWADLPKSNIRILMKYDSIYQAKLKVIIELTNHKIDTIKSKNKKEILYYYVQLVF